MNLNDLRKQYPQYDDMSDGELAKNFHSKFYSDMPFSDFAEKVGYQNKPASNLKPLTDEQRSQASDLAKGLRPQTSLVGDALDVAEAVGKGGAYVGSRILNGFTFGGSDWLENKLTGGNSEFDRLGKEVADNAEQGGKLSSTINSAGNVMAELGGGMNGASKLTYNLAAKGLKGAGNALKSNWLANSSVAPLALSGGVDAGINSAFRHDFSDADNIKDDAKLGALFGGGFGVAGKVLNPVSKLFSANSMTKGLKGGLHNVAENPQAVKILNSGIRQNDDVAQEFLEKAPQYTRKFNTETADLVDNSIKRRIDVPTTVANQRAKYRDFLNSHAGDEVVDFTPSREQFKALTPQSKYNPNKDLSREKAEILLRKRNALQNQDIFNDGLSDVKNKKIGINHFLGSNRRPYLRTLNHTMNNPDLRYKRDGRRYSAKKYLNGNTNKELVDLVITDNGKLFNKFQTNSSYLSNELKKNAQDVSLSERLSDIFEGSTPISDGNIIPHKNIVVNERLPNITSLYEGLTPFQKNALQKAFSAGTAKTNHKVGSLESVNKVKQELNDMIVKSQNVNPNNRLTSIDSPDTIALREVKNRVDEVLGHSLKGRDRGYRKAKELENAYNAGLRYNANNMNNVDLVPELSPLKRHAFAQGLFRRVNNNPLTGQNLASNALKYENTLADILPREKYNPLMQGLNRQSTKFNRLAELGRKAESKLRTPEASRLFGREQLETKTSLVGAGVDWLNSALRGRAITQASQNLMDPNFVGLKDSWVLEKYPYLANYLSAVVPEAKNY